MEKSETFNTETFKCRNIYADLFLPLERRPRTALEKKPILFAWQSGIPGTEEQEFKKIKAMLDKLNAMGVPYVIIKNRLTFQPKKSLIQIVKDGFEGSTYPDAQLKSRIQTIITTANFQITPWNLTSLQLVDALFETLKLYLENESNSNSSKIANFLVKLMTWLQLYQPSSPHEIDDNSINPKCFHIGDLQGLDVYYLFLCKFLGIDAIHFSFTYNDGPNLDDVYKSCVQQFIYPHYAKSNFDPTPHIPILEENEKKSLVFTTKATPRSQLKIAETTTNLVKPKKKIIKPALIKHLSFRGDLNLALSPLMDRKGYRNSPNPVIPTCFIRFIGINSDPNEYYNYLFNFNKKCSQTASNYLMIDTSLKIGDFSNLSKVTATIWRAHDYIAIEDMKTIVSLLKDLDLLAFLEDGFLIEQAYGAILETMILAFRGERLISTSKVKNLLLKLLGWLMDYGLGLLKGFKYSNNQNPIVLFHGDIKIHEALFLFLLYHMGIDIVYVNSFHDSVFEVLDPDETFSTVHVLDTVQPLKSFPKSEALSHKQTVALQASLEIEQIIYNDQDGLYKPWQLDTYKVMPVSLKTTYDEVFILWNEASRMRPGFKVENKTVYIPNLFVKISGTHEDLDQYWEEVYKITSNPNTAYYSKLPFTNGEFNNQELYLFDSVFDNHTTLNYNKLTNCEHYKYHHLSDSLQVAFFEKLDMLLCSDIVKRKTELFRLKIVQTILQLDDTLLKMIQSFDFPAYVPKLVIFDSDEQTFSEKDAITLAFLYLLGIDICVLTPTGYNNFEMFINNEYFNVFKLPQKQYHLDPPDLNDTKANPPKGFWSSIFG